MKRLLQIVVAGLIAAPAFGAPTTWTFTGVVTANDGVPDGPVGQAVSGSITIDTSALYLQDTDGSTSNDMSGYFYGPSCLGACVPKQTNPLQVSAQYSDGSQSISVGGAYEDFGAIWILRNNRSEFNHFVIRSRSRNPNENWIMIQISDQVGAETKLFKDPAGGLDINQEIDWSAERAYTAFQVFGVDPSTGQPLFMQEGDLTSVIVSNMSAPEPPTLALAGMALIWLVKVRRFRKS